VLTTFSSVAQPVALQLARQAEGTDDVAAPLLDACGETPNWLCERVFEWTDGNETAAGAADWLVGRPLTIVLILLGAWVVSRFARRYVVRTIEKLMAPTRDQARRSIERLGFEAPPILVGEQVDPRVLARRASRATSVGAVVCNTVTVLIWSIAIVLVLGEIGLALGPFIAGAGIVGVALGFGAQSLVKDCITGLFMLLEDQYGIGDVVDLGEAIGTVEAVALRTTVLRGIDGTVWHVPNGEIVRVGNKSQLWSTALIDIDVAYDADLDRVRQLLLDTALEVCAAPEWADDVLEEPQVLGVEMLGADGITFRMVVKTAPGAQWALQRALREAFKHSFDAAGIEIPFPQRTIWMRNPPSE
jgi:moderate conductance mechanosensitive channel